MSNKRGRHGYAIVAVDTATRQAYGALLMTKTGEEIVDAFQEMAPGDIKSPQVPQVLDTDQEAGWTRFWEWREFLEEMGINQRFKTDEFAVNNLSMVDNRIRFIKEYIRKRMTEEGEENGMWDTYFNEALDLSLIHISEPTRRS